ncbi:Holliday junction branch migration protein RuvA [Anaerocolumna sp. AGMB13025]|uniref:Holliday junction branch migration protein RuvA n=1 Tax=Anaerocolumna sp. AGMB13025 TaxID=3039116 RepID=UPI00241C08CB|nr:Holliday junction branch migration protein RuvA [Anaerocolumna sp. AGMB13025]WFR59876.1 Holliday junction branch migration protein RuvA [Anaerocolumna sp. AGMB13025]
MISYIKGELTEVSEEGITIEANGLGYEVRMPLSSLDSLPRTGSQLKVYTYLYVREDAIGLFGFLTRDDLKVFKLLITVNGIGPKGALGILSAITPDDLRFAVLSDDVKTIAKAPGIGNKTASKLIIELKDKLKLEDAFEQKLINQMEGQPPLKGTGSVAADIRKEAIEALVVLGYSATDAAKVVRNTEIKEGMTSEDVLKQSLKSLL